MVLSAPPFGRGNSLSEALKVAVHSNKNAGGPVAPFEAGVHPLNSLE